MAKAKMKSKAKTTKRKPAAAKKSKGSKSKKKHTINFKRPSNAVIAKAAALLGALGVAAVAFQKRDSIKSSVEKIVARAKKFT